MSVKIVTDSSANLTQEEAFELGVSVVPLKVIFGEKEYRANVDIGKDEFYRRLKESKNPPTSAQPSTVDIQQAFEEGPETEVLGIFISSKLSGTYQGAVIAAENTEGRRIYIVDSESASIGERILVLRAVQLRNKGMSAAAIAEALNREKKDIVVFGVLDTLKYLHKGGRLSAAAALAGTVLGVKPIICLQDGAIVLAGKERGRMKAFTFLKDTITGVGPVDRERPFAFGFTDNYDDLKVFKEVIGKEYNPENAVEDRLSCEIGTHVGPGALGLAYFKEY